MGSWEELLGIQGYGVSFVLLLNQVVGELSGEDLVDLESLGEAGTLAKSKALYKFEVLAESFGGWVESKMTTRDGRFLRYKFVFNSEQGRSDFISTLLSEGLVNSFSQFSYYTTRLG